MFPFIEYPLFFLLFTLSTWRDPPGYADKGQNKVGHGTLQVILNSKRSFLYHRVIYLRDHPGNRPRKSLEKACCSYLVNGEKKNRESAKENARRGIKSAFPFISKKSHNGGVKGWDRQEKKKKKRKKMRRLWKTATSHRQQQQHAWLVIPPSASHLSEVWALGWAGICSQPRKERKSEDIFNRLLSTFTL